MRTDRNLNSSSLNQFGYKIIKRDRVVFKQTVKGELYGPYGSRQDLNHDPSVLAYQIL